MEKLAPNPIRIHLEELAQALSLDLRSIPDYQDRPNSAMRQAARLLLDGIATVLDTDNPEYYLRAVQHWVQADEPGTVPVAALHQALDLLEDRVMPCVDSPDDLRRMWLASRKARTLFPNRASAAPTVDPMFELIMDNLPQKAFWTDVNGVVLGCNLAYAHDAGRNSVAEMIGLTNYDLPWREYADKYLADDRAVMESGVPQLNFIEEHLNADGETQWVEVSKIPVRDKSGKVFASLGLFEDVTERVRRERAIAENEALLELVLSHIPQAVFWKDREGVFLGCNQALANNAGLASPEDLIGKTDYDMPWKDEAEAYRADDRAVIESGIPRLNYEESQTTSTGEIRWISTSKVPMQAASGEVFAILGMFEDVTERKRLEQQLQGNLVQRGYQVQVSTQIAQEIAAAPDLGVLFERVVTLVKEQFGYYHTQILRYEPGLDAVVLIAAYGETGRKMLDAGHKLALGEGLIGTSAAAGRTMLRPSLANDPEWRPNPLLPETKGEIAVPIRFRDRVLGVLDVQSDRDQALTEDDRLLLEGLCGQIAVAIEDTRLRQEMEERLRELDTLYRSTSREGWQAFGQRRREATAYLYDQMSVQTVTASPVQDGSNEPPDSQIRRKRQTGELSLANGSPALPAGEAAAVSSLSVRGEIIGALGVYEEPDRPLTSDERRLIEQVSEQVAQALESARLFEQTQQALAETQMLFAGSAQVMRSTSYQEIIEILVNSTPLARLDRASLMFFDRIWVDQAPDDMVITAAWDKQSSSQGGGIGDHLSVATFANWETIVDRTQPHLIADMYADPRVTPEMVARLEARKIRGTLVWPLLAGGEFYGYLTGQSSNVLAIQDDEMRLLASLMDQAAIAIRSLMLRKDMSARVEELTALQRLMSREAWGAYQNQAGAESSGYLFDLVNLHPVTQEMIPEFSDAGPQARSNGGSSGLPGASSYATTLAVSGEPVGTLGVRLGPGRVLSPDDEAFLQAISEQVAQAMERARLVEQTQKSAVELQAVAEVGTATATILDPDTLLQQVADLTQQRFGLYHANIYLLDDSGQDLILTAASGKIGQLLLLEGWSISIDQPDSVVAKAGWERSIQVLGDVRQEAGHLKNPSLPNTRAELAVPLMLADKVLGVFDVQSDVVNRFTPEDLRIYNTLAAQVAVALQNAKLYAEQLATLERMRELDNMKSAFLANMSHELRTPLNSILGFTQVILEGLDGPVTEIMTADLDLIEKNGKHLLNLINEILDMSKIESGRLSLSPEEINLCELLEDVIGTAGPLARNRDLFVDLHADPLDDWTVMADQVRLRQIFINLVGNSLKFTEKGGVSIELQRAVRTSDDGNEIAVVQIRFKDTGIGIPADKLEDIFEAFTQVDSSTTRKVGGTGLGLPISRRLVEMHGGRLWAESEGLGSGASFVLDLPVGNLL